MCTIQYVHTTIDLKEIECLFLEFPEKIKITSVLKKKDYFIQQ